MDLHAYLSKHDGRPRTDGDEGIRLARAVGMSPYYLYLTALGHKRVGKARADKLAAASIGSELEAGQVNTHSRG